MPDETRPLEIHTTDRSIFKTCRQRWDFSSPLRMNLEPVRNKPALSFGTAYHEGLASYYSPANTKRDIDEGKDAFGQNLKRWYESLGEEPSEEDTQQYEEQYELGLGMLDEYASWAKANDQFEPVWVEKEYHIPLTIPGYDGEVVYSFKPDGLAVDRNDKIWILEHKSTAKVVDNTDYLMLDDQVGSYLAGIKIAEKLKVEGCIYTMHRKKVPVDLRRLVKGGGFSKDLRQDTTYTKAVAQLKAEYGENIPQLYEEFLQHLYNKGNTFFQRDIVRRNADEIEKVWESILLEIQDMIEPVSIYRNPSRWNCSNCSFVAPCIATYDSRADREMILNGMYRNREEGKLLMKDTK